MPERTSSELQRLAKLGREVLNGRPSEWKILFRSALKSETPARGEVGENMIQYEFDCEAADRSSNNATT